jgi:hypothetical protein
MGTESPKRIAFVLGFSLLIASFFMFAETKTLFDWRFGPPLAMALGPLPSLHKSGVSKCTMAFMGISFSSQSHKDYAVYCYIQCVFLNLNSK